MNRRAARVDANQTAVVKALRAAGASVQSLASIGHGCPDLLVGWHGTNLLMEVKDGSKPPSERRLTPDQFEWSFGWRGTVVVVETREAALEVLAMLDEMDAARIRQRTQAIEEETAIGLRLSAETRKAALDAARMRRTLAPRKIEDEGETRNDR